MVGLSSQYVTLADGRSFSSLSDSMSARELGTVRSYLKVPGLTWKLMPRAEILLHESTMIATPSTLTAASVHMQPDGSRLFTVQDGPDARGEYVIDSAGRLTSARLWVRDRGAWMPASKVLSSFEPVTVNPPASGTYLAEDVVQTAYEAARLPRTLRAVTREVRRSRPRTVGILARSTKRAVAVVNRIVSVPSARVRWARRPQGVKIWAHNRYTDATVSCRMDGPQDWATICSP